MSPVAVGRRRFLKTASSVVALPWLSGQARASDLEPITFGLCADVHQDVMHDAPERLGAFVSAMNERQVDFIAQLGDFCVPKPENRAFLDVFRSFRGPHHHVLGNHDTDDDNLEKNGFTRDQAREFWGMERPYYAFVHGGVRFIVLDGNDRNPDADPSEYPRHVGEPQRRWLARELETTDEPVILLSHQSAEHHWGLDNGPAMRALLEEANRASGHRRVLAWLNGHAHLDDLVEIEGIPYVQVNSMSYFWLGERYQNYAYPAHVHAARPMMEFTAPYRDPVWTTVSLDPNAGEIRIEAHAGEWAGIPPGSLGYGKEPGGLKGVSPRVTARRIAIERPL